MVGPGTTEAIGPMEVLAFWRAAGPDKWFEKDAAFDAEIAVRFSCLRQTGRDGKLAPWEETPEGALALVIVLDQFLSQHVPRRPARLRDRRCCPLRRRSRHRTRVRPTSLACRAPVLLSAIPALGKSRRSGTLPRARARLRRR